jgi:alpha,alpha-trehalase
MSKSTTITPGPSESDTASKDFRPIADYGLLADCNSAALVDRYGSIDWLCLPRYDSASIFARILDPAAGHWSIRPRGPFSTERRYPPARS